MEDKSKSVLDEVIQHAQTLTPKENEGSNQENTTSQEKAEEQSQTFEQEKSVETQAEPKKRGRPKKEDSKEEEAGTQKEVSEEKKAEETPKKKFWQDEEGSAKKEDTPDYKSLWEQSEAKLKRFNKPVLDQLADAMEAPDFDVDKFFESYKPKDFKEFTLEELWKMQKKTSSNVEYSDDELDELWQEEYETVSGSKAKEKSLKDKLISELRPKMDLGKEPEYVTNLKTTVAQQREVREKQNEAFTQMMGGLMEYADTLDGAEIVEGLSVAPEDVEEIKTAFKPGYYVKEDGSPNIKKMVNDKVKAQMFDKLINHLEEMAKMQAKKEVYRPDNNSVNSDVTTQESRSHSEKVVNDIIQNKDLLKKK